MTRSRSLRSDLANCTGDGATYSFMVGAGEAYFIPFVLALGVGEVAAGLYFSIPYLVGSSLQLLAPHGVSLLGSPRRWVVSCACAQCLSFVPLIAGAVVGTLPPWILLSAFAIYWGAAIGAGPAWNAWVAALIPSHIRPRYFGSRNRLCQWLTLIGLGVAGAMLTAGEHGDAVTSPATGTGPWEMLAFAGVFLMAATSRAGSVGFLLRQAEPPLGAWQHRPVPLRNLLVRPLAGRERPLVLFLLVFQLALQVSSPFVASYLIGEVGYTQGEYFIAAAILFGTKSLSSRFFGALAARRGARFVLALGAAMLTVHAALFALPPSSWLIYLLMAASGVCWSAYELANFLLFLDLSKPDERTSVFAAFNFLNALALLLGSLAGGTLLHWLGDDLGAYSLLFLASALARMAALPLLKLVKPPLRTSPARDDGRFNALEEDGSLVKPPETIP